MPSCIQLQLRIFEGTNFHLLDPESSLKFVGSIDGIKLSTNPIPLKSATNLRLNIGEEMIWKMSYRSFQRIKKTKALKLECLHISSTGSSSNIGYIILSLKSVTDSSKSTKGWRGLLGSSCSTNNCPQLLISLYTDTGEDTNKEAAAAPSSELTTDKSVPQLQVKNGLTYIGSERFCTKRFQVTCVLHQALNLHLLIPQDLMNPVKKTRLEMIFLGQPLSSSLITSVEPQINFDKTFVFDVMSSEDTLKQFLKENIYVELEFKAGKELLGRCKQFTDLLSLDQSAQLVCFMSGTSDVRSSESEAYPTVEVSLAIQRLDTTFISKPNKPVRTELIETYDVEPNTGNMPNDLYEDQVKHNENDGNKIHLEEQMSENVGINNNPAEEKINEIICGSNRQEVRTEKLLDNNDDVFFNDNELLKDLDFDFLDENHPPEVAGQFENSVRTCNNLPTLEKENIVNEIEKEIPQSERQNKNDVRIIETESVFRLEGLDNLTYRQSYNHLSAMMATPPVSQRSVVEECHEPEEQRAGAISPSVYNSEILTKIVEELEEWKFRQKILFSEDLKQQRDRVIAQWEVEQRARCEQLESEQRNALKETNNLAKELEQKMKILQQQSQESAIEEKKFKDLYETVHREYSSKKKKFLHKLEEAKDKIDSQSHQIKQLKRQLEKVQNENLRITRKNQVAETAQLTELKQKVRQLEQQLLLSQQERSTFVQKWVNAQRAIDKIIGSGADCPDTRKQHREKVILSSLAKEQQEMRSERLKLEHLRDELEKFGQDMAAACADNSIDPKPQDVDTPISQLRRLEEEKETLLRSGVYEPDDPIIRDIIHAMENEPAGPTLIKD